MSPNSGKWARISRGFATGCVEGCLAYGKMPRPPVRYFPWLRHGLNCEINRMATRRNRSRHAETSPQLCLDLALSEPAQPPDAPGFVSWFAERHANRHPFPWQSALARRIADGDWPSALTPPTGAGKTAVVAVWLWALELGLAVPRRLVYVVDRRLVVDEVALYADRLAAGSPLKPAVVSMRGGIAIDDAWLDPLRPAVITTTIDQAGSRLLFAGYGVSRLTRSIHAGLLGNDALWVIDEVHLAGPLLKTLKAVQTLRGPSLGLPLRMLPMSATFDDEKALGLGPEDRADPVLAPRLMASKPVTLLQVAPADLVETLVAQALALRAAGRAVVAVILNRVDRARAVHARLALEGEAVLLTGRIRAGDRESLLREYLPRLEVGSRARGRAPLFLVATQTIEVGANLDLDALVTECAALSALRQRAGRLDRLGELGESPLVIVYAPEYQTKANVKKPVRQPDPIYGEDYHLAWEWMRSVTDGESKPTGKGRSKQAARREPMALDFGLSALERIQALVRAPAEPEGESPVLLSAHLDRWSRTSIRGQDPNVAPWLHGWQRNTPEVYLCWRADAATDAVEAAPPVQAELLALPIGALRRWSADVGDLEGADGEAAGRGTRTLPWPLIRWDGERAEVIELARVRPGDTLILPDLAGGCDRFGWAPDSREPVPDLGNTPDRLRLHPRVVPALAEDIARLLADEETDAEDWRALAREVGFANPGRVQGYEEGVVVFARRVAASARGYRAIPLADHSPAVGGRAERLAEGLEPELRAALRTAGEHHDDGKADRRWQAMVGAPPGLPLAKGPGGGIDLLPRGWRHEMASAVGLADPLVRHLVLSHHGHGRGSLPIVDPELWRQVASGAWMELQQAHGYWGLAYLEAVLRIADWQVSGEEQSLVAEED